MRVLTGLTDFQVIVVAIALLSPSASAAGIGSTDIQSVCKDAMSRGDSQITSLCNATSASYLGYATNENNSRVWAPVATVCGHTCILSMSGIPTAQMVCSTASIQGTTQNGVDQDVVNSQISQFRAAASAAQPAGPRNSSSLQGGDPCGSTVNAGLHAYGAHKAGKEDQETAQRNFQATLEAAAASSVVVGGGVAGGQNGDTVPTALRNLPTACRAMLKSGSMQDRLDCSLATDSQMPRFIKDPRFLAEFKNATGNSLDSVIGQPSSDIVNSMAPAMLQRAASSAGGKLSLSQFVSAASALGKAVANSLPSAEDRASFMEELLPGPLKNFLPSFGGEHRLAKDAAPPVPESPKEEARTLASATKPVQTPEYQGDMLTGSVPDRSPADEEGSIFEKVSRCYQRVSGRISADF